MGKIKRKQMRNADVSSKPRCYIETVPVMPPHVRTIREFLVFEETPNKEMSILDKLNLFSINENYTYEVDMVTVWPSLPDKPKRQRQPDNFLFGYQAAKAVRLLATRPELLRKSFV